MFICGRLKVNGDKGLPMQGAELSYAVFIRSIKHWVYGGLHHLNLTCLNLDYYAAVSSAFPL